MNERVKAAEFLGDLEFFPLEPGWTAAAALILIKLVDADGDYTWAYRATTAINREELLGALRVHAAITERELVEEFLDAADD